MKVVDVGGDQLNRAIDLIDRKIRREPAKVARYRLLGIGLVIVGWRRLQKIKTRISEAVSSAVGYAVERWMNQIEDLVV
jgi:hypothetical protein